MSSLTANTSLQLAVVLLGPDMLAGFGVDKLAGDADALARGPHAPFEEITHTEILRDLPHVDRFALVDEARIASDDEQPTQPRQRRDDVLGDAVREEFLLWIAAEVGERQDRDGRPVRRRSAGRAAPRAARCGALAGGRSQRKLRVVSTIASVLSENRPVSSLSTVDLPSLVLKANCSREIRSRAR